MTDELELLDTVLGHLGKRRGYSPGASADYDAELIELRDAIAISRAEDLPPLVEHMTRIQALAAQRGASGGSAPVDARCPYFGHLRLDEDGQVRDVLVGKTTYLAPEQGVRIVDWRNAPVSRMYYCYDAGDDYEESFGGRVRRGVIAARRSVTISDGVLRRVACADGTFVLKKGEWARLQGDGPRLQGGQGASIRAEGLSKIRGTLGVDANGQERADKHLPEISGLLDKEQFEIIASPASGMVVVQGSAGSGKTTVGLHRIAYLVFEAPNRFRPRRMLVVVFNDALATYVSGVLPALGVEGVRVATFERWIAEQRRRHVRGLPKKYSEWTPTVVSRLKRHPAMLRMLDDIVDEQDERLSAKLLEAVRETPDGARVAAAWKALARTPLDGRRVRMAAWLDGEARIGGDGGKIHPRTEIALDTVLAKMKDVTEDVLSDWAELLTNRETLGRALELHAPTEFTEGELDEVCRWCSVEYARIAEAKERAEDDERPEDRDDSDGDGRGEDNEVVLDREDDAILVRLHQLKRGPLRGPGGRLELDHLMVDEAQDFSALEIAVMMETVGHGRPITLAGDTAQRICREGGFDDWDELLSDLGVAGGARVEPLKIAYRSTAEVMRVAQEVLGPFAGEPPVAERHGAEVEAHRFSDVGQAVDFIGGALRDLSAREPMANVAVIARHPAHAKLYFKGLEKSEVPRLELVADQDFSFAPGVEVTDVRQVKGLEFDYVILVDVNADTYPDSEEARHLLHVGATRAAHQLWIVCTAQPSPLIPNRLFVDE